MLESTNTLSSNTPGRSQNGCLVGIIIIIIILFYPRYQGFPRRRQLMPEKILQCCLYAAAVKVLLKLPVSGSWSGTAPQSNGLLLMIHSRHPNSFKVFNCLRYRNFSYFTGTALMCDCHVIINAYYYSSKFASNVLSCPVIRINNKGKNTVCPTWQRL